MRLFAKHNDIEDPMTLSTSVLAEIYKLEKERTRRVLDESAWMRTKYLNAKLQDAINEEKDEDVTRLEMLIKNERQKKTWRGIQYITKPNRAGGDTKVIIPCTNADAEVCNTKTTVERGLADSLSD